MADMNDNRPLSPFMLGQYYRVQVTSASSLLTRITGLSLIVAALMIVWWFAAAAVGPDSFATADGFVRSWFGELILFLSVWALWYHLLAGLRHLYWDSGRGLELETAQKLGWACIYGSVILAILTPFFLYL